MKVNLKKLRKKNNLTQSDLAELVGVKRSTITMIESGYNKPSIETAKRIAKIFNFDWTLFFN